MCVYVSISTIEMLHGPVQLKIFGKQNEFYPTCHSILQFTCKETTRKKNGKKKKNGTLGHNGLNKYIVWICRKDRKEKS